MVIAAPAAFENPREVSARPSAVLATLRKQFLLYVTLAVLALAAVVPAQDAQPASSQPVSPQAQTTASPGQSSTSTGVVTGTITDKEGALAVGAQVTLTQAGQPSHSISSGNNGDFSFENVAPGPFQLKVTAPGFDTQQYSGQLQSGQALLVPPIKLAVTGAVTEVKVGGTPEEIAEVEVKQELQQRVFGFIPNFYVVYNSDPSPLFAKQKFNLAWKSVQDPVTILGVAFLAGIYQAADVPGGYGQGAEGYGKRFGAAYGDVLVGTFVGSALLPSVLHQDPRYFYQGTGTTKSRLAHALENAVIARNDRTKKWEPNYSGILGSFAAGAISYTYIPPRDRSAGIFFQESLVRVAESSVAGVLQEFVLRRFTSHVPKQSAVSSQP